MSPLLPEKLRIAVRQADTPLERAGWERCEQLLVLLPDPVPPALWDRLPDGAQLARAAARHANSGRVPLATARLRNGAATGVAVAAVKPAASRFAQLELARKLAAHALAENPAQIAFAVLGFDDDVRNALVECMLLALQTAAFELPRYHGKRPPRRRLTQIQLLECPPQLSLDKLDAVIDGNNLARWLTALPPNRLDAAGYRRIARQLATEHGWRLRFYDEKALKRVGAGAFLAVSQGNASRDAGIVHLRYRPPGGGSTPALSLVGKGVLFDTGGTNLKPHAAMLDMHMDMAGSATALGTLLALTRMRVPYAIDCWLPITENRIGPLAYKPQDVVTAANGTTIQVVHTDAEGRMVLADTLVLASRARPQVLLDYATLTGSCVYALTDRYSGVFTNRPALHPLLIKAGQDCGERVWPFPMDEDFDELLKSDNADVLQCIAGGQGDHILAARFLSRFVDADCCWIHMDLASGFRKGGLGFAATAATGFGVLYSVSLLAAQVDGPAALIGSSQAQASA